MLDTNIIIDHLRVYRKSDSYFAKIVRLMSKEVFALSSISIQELYIGQSSKDIRKEKEMLLIIRALQLLPYTYEVAQLAGEIARDRSTAIGFADAAIAATTMLNGCHLFTLNKKDFTGIKDLQLID